LKKNQRLFLFGGKLAKASQRRSRRSHKNHLPLAEAADPKLCRFDQLARAIARENAVRRKVGGSAFIIHRSRGEPSSGARGDSRTKRISAAIFRASAAVLQNAEQIRLLRNAALLNSPDFSPESCSAAREKETRRYRAH